MSSFPFIWVALVGLMSAITIVALIESNTGESSFVFGSAHEHASISIIIQDDEFDLTKPEFQLQSPFIHLENNNGYVIHRHSQYVTLGYLFQTLNFEISPDCLVVRDGTNYCTNENYSLKYFINEKKVNDIRDYLIWDGDYILISYGDQTQEEIEQLFVEQKLRGFPFQIREKNNNFLANV